MKAVHSQSERVTFSTLVLNYFSAVLKPENDHFRKYLHKARWVPEAPFVIDDWLGYTQRVATLFTVTTLTCHFTPCHHLRLITCEPHTPGVVRGGANLRGGSMSSPVRITIA